MQIDIQYLGKYLKIEAQRGKDKKEAPDEVGSRLGYVGISGYVVLGTAGSHQERSLWDKFEKLQALVCNAFTSSQDSAMPLRPGTSKEAALCPCELVQAA